MMKDISRFYAESAFWRSSIFDRDFNVTARQADGS